ncbi:hypothetical protein HAH_1669 [Haloarcula hispanica ATCC 33960]|uniref:Uncharacterized protein n=1 Tax=Haloarcula hispanica (strain ATCC 33960 / DSM 4426 / JCM 8911 / NBRC 102182 / NCIMB 2187 / VKM B-1755) TaxID=634497 RepID=G0HSQ1_HALHT|nr:hypothetical protein HAH_1669 [Haloarcula hispanica ATCC 33960]
MGNASSILVDDKVQIREVVTIAVVVQECGREERMVLQGGVWIVDGFVDSCGDIGFEPSLVHYLRVILGNERGKYGLIMWRGLLNWNTGQ